jgi:hypothetical protein
VERVLFLDSERPLIGVQENDGIVGVSERQSDGRPSSYAAAAYQTQRDRIVATTPSSTDPRQSSFVPVRAWASPSCTDHSTVFTTSILADLAFDVHPVPAN